MSKIVGHISQVIGPVVDVHFNLEGLDGNWSCRGRSFQS